MAEREQEVFLPEEVDEQIDAYLVPSPMNKQSLDKSAQDAVQALQGHFAPPEQDAALQRVWQRFEQRRTTIRKRERAKPRATTQQERRYRMKQVASRKENGGLLARRLSLVAAVIFVALLVGSMAVLFQRGHTLVSGRPKEEEMFALVNRTLYRLDIKTHQPLWHFQVSAGTDGRPGSIISRGQVVNDTYYLSGLSGNQEMLYALDVASGKVRWHIDFSGNMQVSGTTVYVSVQMDSYVTVEALDSASGAKKWEHHLVQSNNTLPFGEPYAALIAASDKAVYGELITPKNGKNSGLRFALSAQDGNPLWQKNEEIAHLGGIDQGFLVDGVLCVAKEDNNGNAQQGFLLGYNAASGEKLWSKQLDGPPSMFGTTVLNSVIYLSTIRTGQNRGNSVYAFSAKDGAQIWQYQDTNTSGSSYPMVTENGVYLNRYAGQTLVALDTESGKVRWTYNFHDNLTVEYPPTADNNQVYLSLSGNMIQILRASDGKQIGSFKVNEKVDPNNRVLLQVVE